MKIKKRDERAASSPEKALHAAGLARQFLLFIS
jgi:hypothetical protein